MSRLGGLASRGAALGALLGGAGLGLVAAAQPWWRAAAEGAAVGFTGSEVTGGLAQALAGVTLAGTLLALALRVRGRRVLAVLLAAVGVGMVATGALRASPAAEAVRGRVRQVSLTDQFALTVTAWPWAYAAAGLLVLAGAVLLGAGALRWQDRAGRFDRAASSGGSPPGSIPADLGDDPAGAWRRLDAGEDPTADPPTGHPDVQPEPARVTMERTQDDPRE